MKTDPTSAPSLSAVRRALLLAGGTALFATACGTTSPDYGPDGGVFVKPRYGYGSPNQTAPAVDDSGSPVKPADERNYTTTKPNEKRTPVIKRDPSDTTVDVTPPEPKAKKKTADETADATGSAGTEKVEQDKPADTASAKPAAPREDLPYGQPVVGKKGYVYSPYAPDKGQVDVEGIPAGTKVKCPYTDKTFRVP